MIQVLGRAALLSGILCRVQGFDKDSKLRALQDCALFLQAQRLGLVVLTANVSDYDILLQLIPTGQVLFYRHNEAIPNLLGLSLCPVVHSMWWKLRDGLF